jgi:DNA N-6-adenine-methyltransferase Dam
MNQSMSVLTSQETVEWYTPPHIIERARAVLGAIDLDPASSDTAQEWIKAATYYTGDTLLVPPWSGRVWLNPPFDDTPAWLARLEFEYTCGSVTAALLLVNSAPGYRWYEEMWRRWPVVCLRERLCFIRADGKPSGQARKAQTIAYFGQDTRRFIEVFRDLGRIFLP